jgi:hypothetical protein
MGVLLASVRQIRPEPVAIAASAGRRLPARAARLLAAARGAWPRCSWPPFVATSLAWQVYFDRKFEQATRVVAAAGGRTYHGPRDRYHTFWHPLWCGLGDFGEKHGYEWRDKAAARYAAPIVRDRYRALGKEPDWPYLFWDPVYNEVLAEKIRYDITHDPIWYLEVLALRIGRVFTWTTPVRLAPDRGGSTCPGAVSRPYRSSSPSRFTRSWTPPQGGVFSARHLAAGHSRVLRHRPRPDLRELVPHHRGRHRAVRADRRIPRGPSTLPSRPPLRQQQVHHPSVAAHAVRLGPGSSGRRR